MTVKLIEETPTGLAIVIFCQGELTQTLIFPLDEGAAFFRSLERLADNDDDFAPEIDALLADHEGEVLHMDVRRMDAALSASERWDLLADELTEKALQLSKGEVIH